MDTLSDIELVVLARSGDNKAFGCLIERYQPMARQLAVSMVSNNSIARELVQEAMLQAYLSLKFLRDERRFKSWLYGITLNVCRSYLRDQKIDFFSWEAMAGGMQLDLNLLPNGTPPDPQQAAEAQELHQLVLAAINTLSARNRTATLLFYYDQLSLREIAASLDVSVVAVKGRLHKSRQQLREKLLPHYLALNPPKQRRKIMIKVTIADVVVKDYLPSGADEDAAAQKSDRRSIHHVVMLLDEAGQRVLPIWIGPAEGQAIALGLKGFATHRPITFNFMSSLLDVTGAELQEIQISALKDDTFYATARLKHGDKIEEIDARPSDAMALAVQTGTPIYVADEVMAQAGIDVTAEMKSAAPEGQGMAAIVEEMAEKMTQFERRREQPPEDKEQELDKTRQELKGLLFGDEPAV